MRFLKYQSNGNDFLLFDLRGQQAVFEALTGVTVEQLVKAQSDVPIVWSRKVAQWCQRHHGIGADGVLVVFSCRERACVLVYNADGSYGAFSGNGARIVGMHLATAVGERCAFLMGEVPVAVIVGDDGTAMVQVPLPVVAPTQLQSGMGWPTFFINVGNPHVIVLKELSHTEFMGVAPALACGSTETGGLVNVTFAWPASGCEEYRALIFERGVGESLSCGSAAVALFHLLRTQGVVDKVLNVVMPGGQIKLVLSDDGSISVSASVEKVFEGLLA